MKRSWLVAVMLFAVPSFAEGDRGWDRERGDRMPDNAVAVDGDKLRGRLDELSDLLDRVAYEKNPRVRQKITNDARRELQELRRMAYRARELNPRREETTPVVHHAPPPSTTNVPPPPPGMSQPGRRVMPITEPAFRDLARALQAENFGRERLRVLETAAPSKWFLVNQVEVLLQSFDFPREKLAAVRILKARTVDGENFYKLYDAFTFSSDKAELKRIIEG
jgi:hypothetical protein